MLGIDKDGHKIERLLSSSLRLSDDGDNPNTKIPQFYVTTDEDKSITFVCHIFSFMPVNMKWVRKSDNRILKEIANAKSSWFNYTIPIVTMNDNGEYNCQADNSVGKSDSITKLEVKNVPLSVEVPYSTVKTTVGKSKIDLPCIVKPRIAKLKWLYNGKPTLPSNAVVSALNFF